MNITKTKIEGSVIIQPKVFNDNRGYFFESYNKEKLISIFGEKNSFVQDNESFSNRGVLRGLHYQEGEYSQAKLLRVVSGEILDVVVDLRPDSKTFLQHLKIRLSSQNKKQLYIPKYFAHGFIVLSETAIINYKCDNFYNKDAEKGIIYNDEILNIDWEFDYKKIIVSDKDKKLPTVKELFLS